MGVFAIDDALRAAAIDAAHELGLFEALATPLSLAQLADRTQLGATHRLAALVDALVALGALTREHALIGRGTIAARSAAPLGAGWGAIADVIRSDRPVAIDPAIERRYHRHLVDAGAPAAREVAAMLRASRDMRAIDLGGGAGAYTRAMLEASPDAHVTLVDAPAVVALAREELAGFGARVTFVAGDARDARDVIGRFERAIVANVLHLHSPTTCAELCAAAARAIEPGGSVAIVDLRRGCLEGEMFALNMAIYTDGGSVYSVPQIGAWLEAAGLAGIEERRLASAPEMVVVLAHKQGLQ